MAIPTCWGLRLPLCIGLPLGLAKSTYIEPRSLGELLTAMGKATRDYSETTKTASVVEVGLDQTREIEETRKGLVTHACKLTQNVEESLWRLKPCPTAWIWPIMLTGDYVNFIGGRPQVSHSQRQLNRDWSAHDSMRIGQG